MIRLRRMLERGRAHPILGPILLILLVLVLAMVAWHAAHDGHADATEVGAICLAIVTFLGLILARRVGAPASTPPIPVRGDRGPPRRRPPLARPAALAFAELSLPLRR